MDIAAGKRMGVNIGRAFKIADEVRCAIGDEGKRQTYSIGAGTEGRYFGEAGGSGKSMIHQFGVNIGRNYTGAGAEIAGVIHKGSEESVV
jgi:hypothetical protein